MPSYRLSGFIAGACYLAFWYSYLFFLPVARIASNYAAVVNSRGWMFVNIFQIFAVIAFVQFYHSIKNGIYAKNFVVTVMNAMQLVGFFCFMGIAFSETFVWPIVAKVNPDMLNVYTGELFTNKVLMGFDIASVLLFMAGNVYFGLKLRKYFPVMGIVFSCRHDAVLSRIRVGKRQVCRANDRSYPFLRCAHRNRDEKTPNQVTQG